MLRPVIEIHLISYIQSQSERPYFSFHAAARQQRRVQVLRPQIPNLIRERIKSCRRSIKHVIDESAFHSQKRPHMSMSQRHSRPNNPCSVRTPVFTNETLPPFVLVNPFENS